MNHAQALVRMARSFYELVLSAENQDQLSKLEPLAVELKQLIDQSGVSEDLGTDLLELTLLRHHGAKEAVGRYVLSTKRLLEEAERSL